MVENEKSKIQYNMMMLLVLPQIRYILHIAPHTTLNSRRVLGYRRIQINCVVIGAVIMEQATC